jgi:hypothetical protein
VAGIGMKYGNDLGFRFPISHVIRDELHVEYGDGQISLEAQSEDTEHHLDIRHLHRNVDLQRPAETVISLLASVDVLTAVIGDG